MAEKPFIVDSLPKADVDFEGLANALSPLSNPTRLELLHYLTRPRYLEEIASKLKMSRQAAQKHVDQLLEIGVIRKQQGHRESGPVVEYLVVPQRLFTINEEFGRLGVLKPEDDLNVLERTSPAIPSKTGPSRGGLPPVPMLVLVHGMKIGSQYPLMGPPGSGGAWLIGRDQKADVCLDYDPFASNRHAEVRKTADGFAVVDAFSTNGTMLNWERLERGEVANLRSGDVIGVGKTLLLFRTP